MNTSQLDSFQGALLHELRAHVASRSLVTADTVDGAGTAVATLRRRPRLRRPAFAVAAAAATVVVTGVWWSTAGTSPAFAVTTAGDGDVTVTVTRIEDAAGLEQALRDKGINADVQYLPWGKMCAPSRYTQAATEPKSKGSWSFGVHQGGGVTMTIPSGAITAGQTLVLELSSAQLGDHAVGSTRIGIATGAVGECVLVDAPPLPPQPSAPPAGGSGATQGSQQSQG